MFTITYISVVIFIATLFNIFSAIVAWQRRKLKGGMYFALAMFALTFWTLFAALDYAAVPLSLKIFFAKLESIGYGSAFPLMTAFCMVYAGNEKWLKNIWVRLYFIVAPTVVVLFYWTNDLHGWVWTGWTSTGSNNVVDFVRGPAYPWLTIVGYIFFALMFINLALASFTGPEPSRKQGRLLLLALIVPIAGNAIYQTNVLNTPGLDWSSIAFSLSGLFIMIALYYGRLLEIVPIARNLLVEHMADGMLALDHEGHLMDFNPAAQTIFNLRQSDLWMPYRTALERWPDVVTLLASHTKPDVTEFTLGDPAQVYDLRLTPLEDRRGVVFGELLVVRNVTARKRAEEALRASEAQNRAIVNSVPDLMFRIDRRGVFLDYVSRDPSRFFISPQEFLNRPIVEILPATMAQDAMIAIERSLDSGQVELFEYSLGVDEKTQYYECRISPLGAEEVLAVVRDITDRSEQEKALRIAQEKLIEQQRTVAIIDERQRLARELHDSVSQSLHSVNLFAETLLSALTRDNKERVTQLAERMQESARQALKEARLLLYQLRLPEDGERTDLFRDVETRLSAVERRAGVRAAVVLEGALDDYPEAWMEHLFRITVEALNNSLKYAQAREVNVTVRCFWPILELEIADDGIGFDPARVGYGGMGLRSMRERVELLGGTLAIQSEPGKGARVIVRLEMKDKQ
jgi:PAS domain S-box-containing protein